MSGGQIAAAMRNLTRAVDALGVAFGEEVTRLQIEQQASFEVARSHYAKIKATGTPMPVDLVRRLDEFFERGPDKLKPADPSHKARRVPR